MLWINLLKQIVLILQSEISPKQVAAGAVLGMILGFTPVKCIQSYLLVVIILMVNVNIGSATLSAGIFSLLALLLDPVSDMIGHALLVNSEALTPFWTNLYNTPLVPFTKFYNTIVLGSFLISIILILPVYLLTLRFLNYYRTHFKDKVAKWKIMKLLKITSAYNVYDKYQQ